MWCLSFSLFNGWRGRGFEKWACQSRGGGAGFGIWPGRRPSSSLFHGRPPWGLPEPPPHPSSSPSFLNNYVLNIQVGCQDDHSETTWKANDQKKKKKKGKWLFKHSAARTTSFLIFKNVSRWFGIHRKMLIWVRNLFWAINISRMLEESLQTINKITP